MSIRIFATESDDGLSEKNFLGFPVIWNPLYTRNSLKIAFWTFLP